MTPDPTYLLIFLGFALWLFGGLICILNAVMPDGNLRYTMTRRFKARLILTGLFFPIAAPIWVAIWLYLLLVLIVTSLYNTIRTAFSRDDGGRI